MLDPTIDRIRSQLEDLAALGDEAAAEAGRRLVGALGDGLRLSLLELVGTVAAEVNAQLHDAHIEVRMGAEPEVVVVDDTGDAAPTTEELTARLTLRLPPALKERIAQRADREGVSVNTWVLQALERTTGRPPRAVGRQLRGYARS